MDDQAPKLPEVTEELLQLLHDNPNTEDVVSALREYAIRAVKEDRERRARQLEALAHGVWSEACSGRAALLDGAAAIRNAPIPKE